MNEPKKGRERRNYARWPVQADATVVAGQKWLGSHACENLSAGGMLLIGPQGLHIGDPLMVTIRLPGMEPIEIEGRVQRRIARNTMSDAYGITFQDLSPETEDIIHNLVLAGLERESRGEAEIPAT